jgi:hypothetical protein
MSHRALIVFAKLPRAGEVKTRLGKAIGMERAAEVYRQFAEHTFSLAAEVRSGGVRVYIFYAPGAGETEMRAWVGREFTFVEQQGETLGDRMKNAFDKTFADGATQTVIIGTDVPEMDTVTLSSAFAHLSTHDIVIGPSTDGGYYLLGMNAPTKDVFAGVVWSVETVLRQTLATVQSLNLTYQLLSHLSDIDTEEDLRSYLRRCNGFPSA